jgi:DNA polymerase III sliding clamp (beta) subunit (PCNA family)
MGPTKRQFTMPAAELATAIGAVYRAAGNTGRSFDGVYVERNGATLRFIATNGHWMAVYSTLAPDGPPCEWSATIIPNDIVAIMKRCAKGFGEVVMDLDAKRATFADGATLPVELNGMTYPDWRQVYAKEKNKTARAEIGFDPRYMADIHESFVAIVGRLKKGREPLTVCLEPGKDLGPMRITCSAAPALEIVLMPARQPPIGWTIGKAKTQKAV